MSLRKDIAIYIIALIFTLIFVVIERKVISPVWLILIAIFLTTPYRKRSPFKEVWIIGWVLLVIYVVFKSGNLLIPFILAFAIALLFAPIVDYFETKRIPRIVSSLFFVLFILGFVGLFLFFLIPLLFSQLHDLLTFLYNQIPYITDFLAKIKDKLANIGIVVEDKDIVNRIVPELIKFIKGLITNIFNITKSLATVIQIILYIVIVPILALYTMLEWRKIMNFLKKNVKKDSFWDKFLNKAIPLLSRYIRSQILLMIMVGTIIGLPLYLLGVKYAILIGFFAGIMNIIPNIGYILSLIPAIIIALLSPHPFITIIKVLAVYLVEQLLENYLLVPKILGDAVKLHPLIIITVLAFATYFSGIVGLIIAVPITALVKIAIEINREKI